MLDRNQQLSEHFKLSEFVRAQDPDPTEEQFGNLKALCHRLEEVRKMNEGPLEASGSDAGWRTKETQERLYKELGGSEAVAKPGHSMHEQGKAMDIALHCFKPGLIKYLENHWGGGMGIYSWGIHLDIGPKRRW